MCPSLGDPAEDASATDGVGLAAVRWGAARRVAFRLLVVYIVLYNLPWPLGRIPFLGPLVRSWHARAWDVLVPLFAERLMGVASLPPARFDDSTWNHVQVLVLLCLAALVTALWVAADRRRTDHAVLREGLSLYLRVRLSLVLFGYGIIKIFKNQFGFPDYETLVQPLGTLRPMQLMPSFMGWSSLYMFFAGAIELLAAGLVLFRRTSTLGALLAFAALANVLVLNVSYGFPVKLFVLHLLLMTSVLLSPDVPRLVNLLLLDRRAEPRQRRRLVTGTWQRRAGIALVAVFVATGALSQARRASAERNGSLGDRQPWSTLDGIWEVRASTRGSDRAPPMATDSMRLRRLLITYRGFGAPRTREAADEARASVMLMNDSLETYDLILDSIARTLTLRPFQPNAPAAEFRFGLLGPNELRLRGTLGGDSVDLALERRGSSHYPLLNRRLRWIIDTWAP